MLADIRFVVHERRGREGEGGLVCHTAHVGSFVITDVNEDDESDSLATVGIVDARSKVSPPDNFMMSLVVTLQGRR